MRDGPSDNKAAMPLPMSRVAVVDRYFMEHRAKLLDLAAFLDRCDRAPAPGSAPTPGSNSDEAVSGRSPRSPTVGTATSTPRPHERVSASEDNEDFRLAALRRAIALLTDDQPERVRRILELLSDITEAPVDHAHTQAATGAPPPQPRDKSQR